MAELGTTNDPKALVPGDPDTLDGTVQMLNSYGDMLAEAGTGLQRIDTSDGWSGTAADGFHKAFHGQPGKWIEAGGAFHSAAQAVGDYVTTLTWAQGQAADAIREYNAGQAATQQAQADHARAVQQAQAQAAAAGTSAPNIPFTDPGEAQRQAAQQTLDRARKQLSDAGNTAADTVDKAKDKAPPKPGFWSQLGSDIEDFAGSALHGLEKLRQGRRQRCRVVRQRRDPSPRRAGRGRGRHRADRAQRRWRRRWPGPGRHRRRRHRRCPAQRRLCRRHGHWRGHHRRLHGRHGLPGCWRRPRRTPQDRLRWEQQWQY